MKLGKLFNVKNWTLQYALELKKWRKIYLLPKLIKFLLKVTVSKIRNLKFI